MTPVDVCQMALPHSSYMHSRSPISTAYSFDQSRLARVSGYRQPMDHRLITYHSQCDHEDCQRPTDPAKAAIDYFGNMSFRGAGSDDLGLSIYCEHRHITR